MIYGVGIDLVAVGRIHRSLDRYGQRFARRILSESEMDEFGRHPRPEQFLARRFAAKEALVKALGTGFRRGFYPREIMVDHDALGKPALQFSARVRVLLDEMGISRSHLSISDEQDYALAYVLLEAR